METMVIAVGNHPSAARRQGRSRVAESSQKRSLGCIGIVGDLMARPASTETPARHCFRDLLICQVRTVANDLSLGRCQSSVDLPGKGLIDAGQAAAISSVIGKSS